MSIQLIYNWFSSYPKVNSIPWMKIHINCIQEKLWLYLGPMTMNTAISEITREEDIRESLSWSRSKSCSCNWFKHRRGAWIADHWFAATCPGLGDDKLFFEPKHNIYAFFMILFGLFYLILLFVCQICHVNCETENWKLKKFIFQKIKNWFKHLLRNEYRRRKADAWCRF